MTTRTLYAVEDKVRDTFREGGFEGSARAGVSAVRVEDGCEAREEGVCCRFGFCRNRLRDGMVTGP